MRFNFSVRKAFSISTSTALVYLFPPKHHLRAAGLLDDVLQDDSQNVPCLMGRAMVYQYADKWKEAEGLYRQVEAIKGPDDTDVGLEAREQRVWCAVRDGRRDEAIPELQAVIDLLDSLDGKEPQKGRSWWRLGQAMWEGEPVCLRCLRACFTNSSTLDGKRDDAYAHWITSLKRLSTYAPSFSSLGIYYLEHASPSDPVRASKCFQKAFELDPREGEAARRLAEGFAEEKEWDLVEVVASRTIAGEGGISGGLDDSETAGTKQCLPTNAWAWKATGVVELVRHMPA